jgi:DNA-binding response OmpR family regulator
MSEENWLAQDVHGRVLYIEDNVVNFAVVETCLSRLPGVQLLHAVNGREGIRMVHSESPDFVLLDMHLGDISGLDVVRQISGEIAKRHLRVTILTGDGFSMDVIKAMSLGAFEYWVKPVDPVVLEAGVRRALSGMMADPTYTLGHGA